MFVIGIDAGGTKTVCQLADERAHVLAEARGPGANLQANGELEVEKALHAVMADAIGGDRSDPAQRDLLRHGRRRSPGRRGGHPRDPHAHRPEGRSPRRQRRAHRARGRRARRSGRRHRRRHGVDCVRPRRGRPRRPRRRLGSRARRRGQRVLARPAGAPGRRPRLGWARAGHVAHRARAQALRRRPRPGSRAPDLLRRRAAVGDRGARRARAGARPTTEMRSRCRSSTPAPPSWPPRRRPSPRGCVSRRVR